MRKRFLTRVFFVLILTVVIFLFFFMKSNPPLVTPPQAVGEELSGVLINPATTTSTPNVSGFILYKNDAYGFSFQHPREGVLMEYDEGGGAATVVYEQKKQVRGFQVYIVPYAEKEISEERFKADIPSGVRKEVMPATLDGVEAVTFTSFDEALGETVEIWAIHNGYLYEITTFKGGGDWFNPIIQSWRFMR